jgi:signal transduction histidine kinase
LLVRAIALLPDDAWARHRELAFLLHRDAIECSYLSGKPDQGERLWRDALEHAKTPLEQAALYDLRVVASTLAGQLARAIDWGAQGLALIGVELPSESGEIERAISDEIRAVEASLTGRSIAELSQGPPILAPEPRMAMQILSNLFAPTYMSRQDLYALVVARSVHLTLVHGIGPQAPFAFAGYGVILPSLTGDYARAHAFGRLGAELARQREDPAVQCRALGMFGTYINSWRAPMRTSVPVLREAVRKGLDSGETQYAAYWGLGLSKHLFCQGVELSRFIAEVDGLIALGRRTSMRAGRDWQLPFRQAARCLQGRTRGRERLDDDEFDEAAYVRSIQGEPYALSLYEGIRLQVLYLGGSFAAARALAESTRVVFQRGTSAVVDHEYYASLARAADPGPELQSAVSAIEASGEKLAMWAANCPENYRHKELLVRAEIERLRGRLTAAAELYDEAIDQAARERFVRDEALAYELAGRFYRALGRSRIAGGYIASAIAAYGRWGATAKSAALEEEFVGLPSQATAEHQPRTIASLDLLGFLEAAQAISSVIELDRLLETLMDLSLSTAGAERGALLLNEDGGLVVRVAGSIGEAAVLERTPLAESSCVPARVIERVAVGGEPLVLSDASGEGPFVDDPYIARGRVRSLLAQPIRKQAKLVGVLVLENNLASRVFGPERLRVLQLLPSLMAVSLENSMLFEKMTAEVRERGRAEDAMRLLADTGSALVESLDHDAIVERVTRVVVPRLADCCFVDVVEDGRLRRVAGACSDVEREALLANFLAHPPRRDSLQVSARCLRTRRPLLLAEISDALRDGIVDSETQAQGLRELGVRSALAVPLVAHGTAIGVVTLLSSTRHYEPRDVALAEELARRAALAMQNARLHAEAHEAVRMRDEFIAIASHELNTPVTSLLLAMQHLGALARSGTVDAGVVTRLVTTGTRQTERLRTLIAELLDVTRLARGELFLRPRSTEMRALVERVIAGLKPELESANCEVRLHAPAPVEGIWDSVRLEQLVTNLLSNAAKFGQGKPIDVAVACAGGRARLSVQDRGIGIEPEKQARIFERFERGVSSTHYGGLGLGLYISRRIVEAHRGTISVESRPGEGARFIIELPLHAEGAARAQASS